MRLVRLVVLLLMALFTAAPLSAQAQSPLRPNVLFAIADDWAYGYAGAYGNRFVNTKGEVFSAPDRVKTPLMQLSGPEDQAVKVLEASRQYEAQLAAKGYKLLGVNLTPRHAWELTLDGNIQLFLGRSDIALRLQRFIDAFPIIEPREQVAYVDLRYDTGMAVGWKKNEEKVNDQNRR